MVRPHDALELRTPLSMHKFSNRKYTEKIVEYEYAKEFQVRYVTLNGAIRLGRSNWLFITTALAGKNVGLKNLGNKIYRLYFREFFLGYVDMNEQKVYDIMNYNNELKL